MFPETFPFVVYTFHIKFYFSGKRQRKSSKNLSKTCHWKFSFVISSYSTPVLRCARHVSAQGTWAGKRAGQVGTWARERVGFIGAWVHKHGGDVGTWARSPARHLGTWARKHGKQVGTWAHKAGSLADSITSFIAYTICIYPFTCGDNFLATFVNFSYLLEEFSYKWETLPLFSMAVPLKKHAFRLYNKTNMFSLIHSDKRLNH